MGIVRDALGGAVDFLKSEVLPVIPELRKAAGILGPQESQGWEPKTSLIDPQSFNFMSYGYKEKFSFLDYTKLRTISYADPIIAAIIQTRTNQVASFAVPQADKYNIGFKIKMRDKKSHSSKGSDRRAFELGQFMMNCGFPESFDDTVERKKRDNFETFLRKLTRDTLTFDQVNFEVVPRRNGMPAEFLAVDAATIRLIADAKERRDVNYGHQDGSPIDYADVMPLAPVKTEHKSKVPRLCQVVRGVIHHTYEEWEMALGVRNPRTDILSNGYGFSEIEMLMQTVTAHMNAETYNRRFFSQGSSIKGVLTFEGSVPPEQLEAFRRQWHQQVSGVNNAWKTPILGLGKESKVNWVNLHSTNREMEWGKYMEYLIKSICGVYQIDPIEIGFDISKNPSGQGQGLGLGGGFAWERLQYSMDKGLAPLLRFLANMLNEYVIWRIDPDFEFEFVGLDARDEKDDLDNYEKQVKTYKTVNELRAENDLPPIKKAEDIKSPGDLILDTNFLQMVQAAAPQPGMGPDGQPMGGPGAGAGGGEEEEPDYENMSTEDLQAEMEKLKGGGQGGPQARQGASGKPQAPQAGAAEQKRSSEAPGAKAATVTKSLELLL